MLQIRRESLESFVSEAANAAPAECCGILLGEGNRIELIAPTRNVHPTTQTHFEIDPQALIGAHKDARDGGPQVIGYFHSHPNGRPEPSATDRKSSAGDGKIWAVIASGEVRFWRDASGGFEALSYTVIDG